jgi:hypothetical protein
VFPTCPPGKSHVTFQRWPELLIVAMPRPRLSSSREFRRGDAGSLNSQTQSHLFPHNVAGRATRIKKLVDLTFAGDWIHLSTTINPVMSVGLPAILIHQPEGGILLQRRTVSSSSLHPIQFC